MNKARVGMVLVLIVSLVIGVLAGLAFLGLFKSQVPPAALSQFTTAASPITFVGTGHRLRHRHRPLVAPRRLAGAPLSRPESRQTGLTRRRDGRVGCAMHEMTIVANVLEIAHRQAAGAGAARINRVVLEVGRLAGVSSTRCGSASMRPRRPVGGCRVGDPRRAGPWSLARTATARRTWLNWRPSATPAATCWTSAGGGTARAVAERRLKVGAGSAGAVIRTPPRTEAFHVRYLRLRPVRRRRHHPPAPVSLNLRTDITMTIRTMTIPRSPSARPSPSRRRARARPPP